MKKISFLILILITGNKVMAQYQAVNQGSSLQFKIQNLGFDVNGSFSGIEGTINFDAQNPTASSFDVSVDANTVNTSNGLRDSHLKETRYFDVKNHPAIHFVSTRVTAANKPGSFTVLGKLSIKEKSQEITFPFTANQTNNDYLFKGSFKIKRKDFGIGGTSTISNDVEISLTVLAKRQ
jgi:polyisoprenoid-binding protein YceI